MLLFPANAIIRQNKVAARLIRRSAEDINAHPHPQKEKNSQRKASLEKWSVFLFSRSPPLCFASECSRGLLVNQVLLWGLFLHLVSWIAVDRNIISLWHLSGGERVRELIYNSYAQDIRITCVVCALGMIPETVRLIEKRYAITFENLWFSPVDNKKHHNLSRRDPLKEQPKPYLEARISV